MTNTSLTDSGPDQVDVFWLNGTNQCPDIPSLFYRLLNYEGDTLLQLRPRDNPVRFFTAGDFRAWPVDDWGAFALLSIDDFKNMMEAFFPRLDDQRQLATALSLSLADWPMQSDAPKRGAMRMAMRTALATIELSEPLPPEAPPADQAHRSRLDFTSLGDVFSVLYFLEMRRRGHA